MKVASLNLALCLLLFCSIAFGDRVRDHKEKRLNPRVVETGTTIHYNATHISAFQPSGRVIHTPRTAVRPHQPRPTSSPSRSEETTNSTEGREKRSPAPADGWAAYYETQMPAIPKVALNNVEFFFNSFQGLAGGDTVDILQPVLQFNQVGYRGRWTVASWWGPINSNDDYTHDTPVNVEPGDVITGIVNLDIPNFTWHIETYVNGVMTNTISVLYYQVGELGGTRQTTAQWAHETYHNSGCDSWSPVNHLTLSNIVIKEGSFLYKPVWTLNVNDAVCSSSGTTDVAPGIIDSQTTTSLTLTWSAQFFSTLTKKATASYGIDLYGSDLYSVTATGTLGCAEACDKNSQCVAWVSNGFLTCFLKSAVPTIANINSQYNSGVRLGDIFTDRIGTWHLHNSPLTLSSASTPSTCAAYCNGEIACQSWAWDSCSYKCNMYADVGRRSTGLKLCMISGVKGMQYTDRIGTIGTYLATFPHPLSQQNDPSACANRCATTVGCSSWVYSKFYPGCPTTSMCYLKGPGVIPVQTPSKCYMTGNNATNCFGSACTIN